MLTTLDQKKWNEFFIGGEKGVFDISSSSSGIDKNKLKEDIIAITPYVTRTNVQNGINKFISKKQDEKYKIDERNVITIGLDTQTIFFQPHPFYTGQNVQVLRHPKLNKYIASFIIPLLKVQMEKFNWGGNGATLGRLFRTKLMLPVDENSQPDWIFMDKYSKNTLDAKKNKYKKYAENLSKKITVKKIKSLKEKKWDEFFIQDFLTIKSGKRLTKADMVPGITPFIGSSDSNNGVTGFVSNSNASEDCNVLGINYNGSVAENFYHPYKALFSDDVKRINFKNIQGNKYLYLFLKAIILKQKDKYQYAYKFNEKRLKRQKVMLPISDNGEPDYTYMEDYIKNLMQNKLQKYIEG